MEEVQEHHTAKQKKPHPTFEAYFSDSAAGRIIIHCTLSYFALFHLLCILVLCCAVDLPHFLLVRCSIDI